MKRTAIALTMSLILTKPAYADLWNDTAMKNADIYFNQAVVDAELNIEETFFARQSCTAKTENSVKAVCSMLIVPTASAIFSGPSLDEPPSEITVIFAKTDNMLALVQTNAALVIGASPNAPKSERSKLLETLGNVVKNRKDQTVTIGQSKFTIATLPSIGIVFSIEPVGQ